MNFEMHAPRKPSTSHDRGPAHADSARQHMPPAHAFSLKFLAGCFAVVYSLGLACVAAEIDIPAQPANHLLDQGKAFTPEVASRLADRLGAAARDRDVHVYVMTVGTLNVMPSRAAETLDQTLKAARAKWLADQVGAVIIFDNETGRAVAAASDTALKLFPADAVNAALKDPELQSKKKHLAPEHLETTVSILLRHMTDLRAKTDEENRRRRARNWMVGGSAIVVVLLVAGLIVAKVRRKSVAATKTQRRPSTPSQG